MATIEAWDGWIRGTLIALMLLCWLGSTQWGANLLRTIGALVAIVIGGALFFWGMGGFGAVALLVLLAYFIFFELAPLNAHHERDDS